MDDIRTLLTSVITNGGCCPQTETQIKNVKSLCRISQQNVVIAFEFLWEMLKEPNSISRFYALQVVDILFTRSHRFRLCLLTELPLFLQYSAGISGHSIPEPREYAKKCRSLSLQLMSEWYLKFGSAYKQLEVGYNYLTQKLGISLSHDSIHFETSQSALERAVSSIFRCSLKSGVHSYMCMYLCVGKGETTKVCGLPEGSRRVE
jgi:hypothetical protein